MSQSPNPQSSANSVSHVFIASSVESLGIAYAIQANLDHDAEVTVWSQGIFMLSKPSLQSLEEQLGKCDFAIFVFTPQDTSTIRNEKMSVVRDNVLFELGLFIGRLGSARCFIVTPHEAHDLHLPTDLIGITPAKYKHNPVHATHQATLGPACYQIRQQLLLLGPLRRAPKNSDVSIPVPEVKAAKQAMQTPSVIISGVTHFKGDDAGYGVWLQEHKEGYVVNTPSKPSGLYFVVHRATCGHIQYWPGRTMTEGQYSKLCAQSKELIDEYAQERNWQATYCKSCKP